MAAGRDAQSNAQTRYLFVATAAMLSMGLALLLFPLYAGAAVEQHLFDPDISLTGACGSEEYDEVPDPWCPGPPGPSAAFENPNIAIDSAGNMYVSSTTGSTGRVYVFTPEGQFITELDVPGARSLAVDPKGNLYVHQFQSGLKRVVLFRPTGTYEPAAGEIAYEDPGEVIINHEEGARCTEKSAVDKVGLAVDPVTEKLFVGPGQGCVAEWSPAGDSPADGPELLDATIGTGSLGNFDFYVAVDHARDRLYVVEGDFTGSVAEVQVFELGAPHAHLGTIDGHTTENGQFLSVFGNATIDVDETSGNLIVSDLYETPRVYEFGPGLGAEEELLETYAYPGFKAGAPALEVAVDNAVASPNYRSFFVPSEGSPADHTFAFSFKEVKSPEVESISVAGVTESEAVLKARINPEGSETTYRIEYTAQPSGFEGAVLAAEGTLAAGLAAVPVSIPINGLKADTAYRFRVVAENEAGSDPKEGSFRTYAPPGLGGPCANDALRAGPSAKLPDCRAYELVTPPDTNGRSPRGGAVDGGRYFPTLLASPEGDKATFLIDGGTIPGLGGAGMANGDNYLSRRGSGGWSTELAGPSGSEIPRLFPGGFSPDQEHSFWAQGRLRADEPARNTHIRYPDGHSEPVGRGSLGVDREVEAKLIAAGGSHTIFEGGDVKLEPEAPPAGTRVVYDRTADEVTHVVSLLPGEVTPAAGQNAKYLGASLDGAGVAFQIGAALYLRRDNEQSYQIGSGVTFAGIAEGGGRIFYLQGGDLFAFDTATETAIRFSEGGEARPVNVSADGTVAYFLSPDVLSAEANPNGALPQAGEENLYRSREGEIEFVGTVEEADVEEEVTGTTGKFSGLGMWNGSLVDAWPATATSRTTPDGSVLLFESRAALAGYDPQGHTEIYRYDSGAGTLACLSCNPTGAAAGGEASLQTLSQTVPTFSILNLAVRVLNLRADGSRAFFQSEEPLVLADTDGKQDIYEWEDQGVGSCSRAGGCVYLISSGQSERDEHLFAASASGDDVFFLSGDLLGGGDTDATPSIYDARVGGGFPAAETSAPCQGEGCRPAPTPPPAPQALFPVKSNGINPPPSRHRCGKGKRLVRKGGKTRCVRKRPRHKRSAHHPAGAKKRGQR